MHNVKIEPPRILDSSCVGAGPFEICDVIRRSIRWTQLGLIFRLTHGNKMRALNENVNTLLFEKCNGCNDL